MDLFSLQTFLLLFCLLGRGAPSKVLPDGPVDAVLGQNVTLRTLLQDPDYMVIMWNYSNGSETVNVVTVTEKTKDPKVNGPYQDRVSINTSNGFLTLRGLQGSDTGDYGINVLSSAGDTSTGEIKLRVLEPVSDVVIKSNVLEAVEHNSTVILTCTAKGSFLKFTWLNGTTPIVEQGRRLLIKQGELSSELSIYGVLRYDLKGPIFCMAANSLETEKSAPFNLTVYYGPENVQILPPQPSRYIRSRSSFNLTCVSSSSPAASYLWYYNEQKVETAGAVLPLDLIEKLGHGKKEGSYTCTATNAKTQRVVRSPAVTFGVMEPISGVKLIVPTGVLVAGNHSANLSCTAAGGVVETRTWLKDGKALRTDGVVYSADRSSILIKPLLKEDNGKFSCRLANPVNSEEASYNLVVNYGPEMPAVTGRDAVEVEDPVTLTCSAPSQPPASYTWKFNGTLTPVKTATYSIDKARYSHSGTYMCEAHNNVTGKKTSRTFTLSVKEELVEGLSDGAIAGIVIAVLVALGAAIALVFYCRQKVPVDSPY